MSLTGTLLRSYFSTTFDLGPCYPDIRLPDWLSELVVSPEFLIEEATCRRDDHRRKLLEARNGLATAAADFIDLPFLKRLSAFITPSGAVSLARAMAACVLERGSIAMLRPTLDLYEQFANELLFHHKVALDLSEQIPTKIAYLDVKFGEFFLSAERIRDFFDKHDVRLFVMALPNNPTGSSFDREQFKLFVELCRQKNVTLILDLCFSMLGERPECLDMLAEEMSDLNWILIWDTGKTCGLRHRKIGLTWCSDSLRDVLDASMSAVVFQMPYSEMSFFATVLKEGKRRQYLKWINDLIASNKTFAADLLREYAAVDNPRYGSFLSFQAGINGRKLAQDLLDAPCNVGVVCWSDYKKNLEITDSCKTIRICAARDPYYFQAGVTRICEYLDYLGLKDKGRPDVFFLSEVGA